MNKNKENFGRGGMGLDAYSYDKSVTIDWVNFAYRVGEENGCPRVKTNIAKIMKKEGVSEEEAARVYIKEHLPLNFWYGWLKDRIIKLKKESLYQSLTSYSDSISEPEAYDDGSVNDDYREGRRNELASDAMYYLVIAIVKRIADNSIAMDVLGEIDEEITIASENVEEFQRGLLDRLERKFPASKKK